MKIYKTFIQTITMLMIVVSPLLAADDDVKATLYWVDARELGLEGQGWTDTNSPYDRLPARAEGTVTPAVWNLQHHSAGLCLRFETNSPEIHANWDGGNAMYHMPRTGMSGLDVYTRNGETWKWKSIGKPNTSRTIKQIATASSSSFTEYLVFLPLYTPVTEMKLGFVEGSTAHPSTRVRPGKPIVAYGTSITQGGCASRTGMSHYAILSRHLDREIINLGFSGAGKMEPEMAELIRELDAEIYVFECLPNMTTAMVSDRVAPFVRLIREERPDTPILLAENCVFSPSSTQNKELKKSFDALITEGVTELYYLPSEKDGQGMLTSPEEGTVDGVHPTDYGFAWMANYFEPVLRELLEGPNKSGTGMVLR
jgi:lysophospholipase L1-like esterase